MTDLSDSDDGDGDSGSDFELSDADAAAVEESEEVSKSNSIIKETRFRSFSVKSEIQLFVMTALRPLFHLPGHNFSNNSQ